MVEKGPEQIRKEENENRAKSRNKQLVEKGPAHIRKENNAWKLKSRMHKMDEEPETVHKDEKKRKLLSRQRLKEENPDKVKVDQRKWNNKRNHVNSEKKRLKKFRERTMFNAIFTCSCCQRNLLTVMSIKLMTNS